MLSSLPRSLSYAAWCPPPSTFFSQDVTLYFNRSRVGVFSTYMVVENLANPADFKVRVRVRVMGVLSLCRLSGALSLY